MRLGKALPRSFYARPTLAVARDLLGKILVLETAAGRKAARIVEVEAYLGTSDPASHAYRGMTARTRPMFGAPGHAYIYISHGIHACMNVVARSGGRPAGAVLLRGAEPLEGVGEDPRRLAGPGLIGRAFGLTAALSGEDLVASRLSVRDAPAIPAAQVGRSPRVGLSPGETLLRPWRFYVRASAGVSRSPRALSAARPRSRSTSGVPTRSIRPRSSPRRGPH
ncbi:MAG: DNA-3-methyladenine glycosylase [Chloroflexi bacterium]|nr:DNA-3-methyladenine glycosylase [Chloroflexota bacterium]